MEHSAAHAFSNILLIYELIVLHSHIHSKGEGHSAYYMPRQMPSLLEDVVTYFGVRSILESYDIHGRRLSCHDLEYNFLAYSYADVGTTYAQQYFTCR